MKTATDSRSDSRRRRKRPSIFEHLAGAATLAELQRACEEPKFFDYLLDASENMDQTTGELYVGLRELGHRHHGMSDSTAYRRGRALEKRGIWTITRDAGRHSYGGRPTCLYTVGPHYLPALIHARHLFRPDWHQRFRKEPSEAAVCFTDEAKGEADRTPPKRQQPSTETSESPTEGRSEKSFEDSGRCADGSAAAPPADLADSEKPEAPERSSEAPLHPRDAAAPPEQKFQPIERRKRSTEPPGPTLKRFKRKLWRDDIDRFIQQHELYTEQAALWKAELEGDEVATQQLLDGLDRRMRAAGWHASPDIRAKRRLNKRGEKRDPAEGERAKQRLAAKHARWLADRGAPGAVAEYWEAMASPDAQAVFDKIDAAYRASGWQDDGGFRGFSRAAHEAVWSAPPAPAATPERIATAPVRRAGHVPAHVAERERRRAEERERQRQWIYGGLE